MSNTTSLTRMSSISKMRALWLLVAALVAGGATLLWLSARDRPQAPQASFTLLDGESLTGEQLRGKVVLVNFWSTDCTTCVHEMPQIVETQRHFQGQGYETVAVAMAYDDLAQVRRFAQSRALPFHVAHDRSGDLARRFGNVRLTPTSVLIDKRGRIVERFIGEPDFTLLRKRISDLLSES